MKIRLFARTGRSVMSRPRNLKAAPRARICLGDQQSMRRFTGTPWFSIDRHSHLAANEHGLCLTISGRCSGAIFVLTDAIKIPVQIPHKTEYFYNFGAHRVDKAMWLS